MIEELNAIIRQARLTEYYYRNLPDEYSKYEKKLDKMKEQFLKKYNSNCVANTINNGEESDSYFDELDDDEMDEILEMLDDRLVLCFMI